MGATAMANNTCVVIEPNAADYGCDFVRTAEEGLAFVPLTKGEVYAVRFFNDSEYDAAVGKLNGLSSFVSQQITMWNKS